MSRLRWLTLPKQINHLWANSTFYSSTSSAHFCSTAFCSGAASSSSSSSSKSDKSSSSSSSSKSSSPSSSKSYSPSPSKSSSFSSSKSSSSPSSSKSSSKSSSSSSSSSTSKSPKSTTTTSITASLFPPKARPPKSSPTSSSGMYSTVDRESALTRRLQPPPYEHLRPLDRQTDNPTDHNSPPLIHHLDPLPFDAHITLDRFEPLYASDDDECSEASGESGITKKDVIGAILQHYEWLKYTGAGQCLDSSSSVDSGSTTTTTADESLPTIPSTLTLADMRTLVEVATDPTAGLTAQAHQDELRRAFELLAAGERDRRLAEARMREINTRRAQEAARLRVEADGDETAVFSGPETITGGPSSVSVVYGRSHNSLFLADGWGEPERTAPDRPLDRYRFAHHSRRAALFGQRLVIDVGFDRFMRHRESALVCRELATLHAQNQANHTHPCALPLDVHYVNCGQSVWTMPLLGRSDHNPQAAALHRLGYFHPGTVLDYPELFPRDRLIFLTATAPDPLPEHPSPDTIFVLPAYLNSGSAFVATHHAAQEAGIRCCHLPVDRYVVWRGGHKTVGGLHALRSILQWVGVRPGDWATALRRFGPAVKIKTDAEVEADERRYASDARRRIGLIRKGYRLAGVGRTTAAADKEIQHRLRTRLKHCVPGGRDQVGVDRSWEEERPRSWEKPDCFR